MSQYCKRYQTRRNSKKTDKHAAYIVSNMIQAKFIYDTCTKLLITKRDQIQIIFAYNSYKIKHLKVGRKNEKGIFETMHVCNQ